MSAEKETTLSKAIPIIQTMKEQLETQELTGLAAALHQQLVQRFGNILTDKHYCVSTFLDPRLKDISITETGMKAAKLFIAQELDRMENAQGEDVTEEPSPCTSQPQPEPKRKGILKNFAKKVKEMSSQKKQKMDRATLEMSRYEEEDILDLDLGNPLIWWRDHQQVYPLMKDIVMKHLCVPATSTPPERVFSKAGELVSHRRSCISPKNVDMVLFLNKNTNL